MAFVTEQMITAINIAMLSTHDVLCLELRFDVAKSIANVIIHMTIINRVIQSLNASNRILQNGGGFCSGILFFPYVSILFSMDAFLIPFLRWDVNPICKIWYHVENISTLLAVLLP